MLGYGIESGYSIEELRQILDLTAKPQGGINFDEERVQKTFAMIFSKKGRTTN